MTRDELEKRVKSWMRKYEAFSPEGRGAMRYPTRAEANALETDLVDLLQAVRDETREACAKACEKMSEKLVAKALRFREETAFQNAAAQIRALDESKV